MADIDITTKLKFEDTYDRCLGGLKYKIASFYHRNIADCYVRIDFKFEIAYNEKHKKFTGRLFIYEPPALENFISLKDIFETIDNGQKKIIYRSVGGDEIYIDSTGIWYGGNQPFCVATDFELKLLRGILPVREKAFAKKVKEP
jgi:hypothetical protein